MDDQSNLKGLNNAWLNKSGRIVRDHEKFYNEGSWHLELAMCILQDLWKLDWLDTHERVSNVKFGHNAIEELESKGWIRLHGFGGLTPVWIVPLRKKATKKQQETIVDWCIANNRDYDQCFAK